MINLELIQFTFLPLPESHLQHSGSFSLSATTIIPQSTLPSATMRIWSHIFKYLVFPYTLKNKIQTLCPKFRALSIDIPAQSPTISLSLSIFQPYKGKLILQFLHFIPLLLFSSYNSTLFSPFRIFQHSLNSSFTVKIVLTSELELIAHWIWVTSDCACRPLLILFLLTMKYVSQMSADFIQSCPSGDCYKIPRDSVLQITSGYKFQLSINSESPSNLPPVGFYSFQLYANPPMKLNPVSPIFFQISHQGM